MARASTTSDVFNAVAEPRRRQILDTLSQGSQSVSQLVEALQLSQPQVSKHLAVLREVDLVHVEAHGRRRIYRVNGPALQPIHQWVRSFEAHWNARLDRLDDYLNQLQQEEP